MRVHQLLKTLLPGLALATMLDSSSELLADEFPVVASSTVSDKVQKWNAENNYQYRFKHAAPTISDIALDKYGDFHGTIVDSLGLPQASVLVIAQQGQEHPRTTRTDGKGNFKLDGIKSGNWSMTVGQKTSWVRVWNASVAPPAAKSRFQAVSTPTIVRGQSPDSSLLSAFDAGTLFSVGAGVAGVTLGVIGISEASEANDDAEAAQASANMANDEAAALRDELNALSTTVETQGTQLDALQLQVDEIQATLN